MTQPARHLDRETSNAQTRRIDWPLIAFFCLAYGIAWGMIPLLGTIARQSGLPVGQTLPAWQALSRMGEAWDFGNTDLVAPGWVVYGITRVHDFGSLHISGVKARVVHSYLSLE